jgi:hypothetical protein
MTEPTRGSRRRSMGPPMAGVTPEERIAELEARLERLEGAPGLRERGRGLMARVVPPEATDHFRNAGREQLLGVRSIVDFWIRRLDEADARAARGARERETIEIE